MKRFSPLLFAGAATLSLSFAESPVTTESSQQHQAGAAELFKKLDTDGDGALSLDEFKAGPAGQHSPSTAGEHFKKLDQNGDGKVTFEELVVRHTATPPAKLPPAATPATGELPRNSGPHQVPPAPNEPSSKPSSSGTGEYFKKMDTNGDGTLSQIEFKAGPIGQKNPTLAETYFKKLDQNGDGKLTQEEFTMRRTLPRSGEQAAGSIVPAVSSPHYAPRRYSPRSALDRKRR